MSFQIVTCRPSLSRLASIVLAGLAIVLAVPMVATASVGVDPIFSDPALGGGFDFGTPYTEVRTIVEEPGGDFLVGGDFTQVSGQPRSALARLNADGSLDPSLVDPKVDEAVHSVALQPDGKILIGGGFYRVAGTAWRPKIARLNPDGTLDTSFRPPDISGNGVVFHVVSSVKLQPDGKILIAGNFTGVGERDQHFVARLNADGSVDTSFNPGVNNNVLRDYHDGINTLLLQDDGRVVIGGAFATVAGQPRASLARLNPDGSLDSSFNPDTTHSDPACRNKCLPLPAANDVLSSTMDGKGRVLIGTWDLGVGSQANFSGVARLNPDGRLDTGFGPIRASRVRAIEVQDDGKIVLGGEGVERRSADGRRDRSFETGVDNSVFALLPLRGGKTLAGGDFSRIAGQNRTALARLDVPTPFVASISVRKLKAVVKDRRAYLTSRFTTSHEGKVVQEAKAMGETVCRTVMEVDGAAIGVLRCSLSAKARSELRRRSLKVTVTTTLTPTDSDPVGTSRELKIKRRR